MAALLGYAFMDTKLQFTDFVKVVDLRCDDF